MNRLLGNWMECGGRVKGLESVVRVRVCSGLLALWMGSIGLGS
jgi:hypothetical protein